MHTVPGDLHTFQCIYQAEFGKQLWELNIFVKKSCRENCSAHCMFSMVLPSVL